MTAVRDTTGVIRLAQALADGSHRLPGLSSPRATCLVARQALELVVADLLDARGLCPSGGSARSRLICLSQAYADHPEVATRAAAAWSGLSTACHHHAYELAPSLGAATALLDEVAWLEAFCQQQTILATK